MSDFEWKKPIVLLKGEADRTITGTRDAAHFMNCEWLGRRGSNYDNALRVCGLVVTGVLDAECSRVAFLCAADGSSSKMAYKSR